MLHFGLDSELLECMTSVMWNFTALRTLSWYFVCPVPIGRKQDEVRTRSCFLCHSFLSFSFSERGTYDAI